MLGDGSEELEAVGADGEGYGHFLVGGQGQVEGVLEGGIGVQGGVD